MPRTRRVPTEREKLFGNIGFAVFALLAFIVLVVTHAVGGLGVGGYAIGGFVVVLVGIWGRIIGHLVARETGPALVARKVPKDQRPVWRQRVPAAVGMSLGATVVFVFGGALIYGLTNPAAATSPGSFLVVALVTAALTFVGIILFLWGWRRWRRIRSPGTETG